MLCLISVGHPTERLRQLTRWPVSTNGRPPPMETKVLTGGAKITIVRYNRERAHSLCASKGWESRRMPAQSREERRAAAEQRARAAANDESDNTIASADGTEPAEGEGEEVARRRGNKPWAELTEEQKKKR